MAWVSISVLGCDQTRIGEQVLLAQGAGADYIHVDVMDGVYVENLSFGPALVADLKRISNVPVSVHLELLHPERYLSMFAKAGADVLTFQMDACPNPIHFIQEIKKTGMKAGVGIGPSYGVEKLKYLLHHIDWLILMSVEPGYGGQRFEESIYEKLEQMKKLMAETGYQIPVSVDGGVNEINGKKLVETGADILIAGSYVFGSGQIEERVRTLKALKSCTERLR